MTEDDWLTCGNPDEMLDYLDGKVSDRKLRLFACACCRRVWRLLSVPACRRAVEVAEQFADGLVSPEDCKAAHAAAQHARPLRLDGNWSAAVVAAAGPVAQLASAAADYTARAVAHIGAERLNSVARASVCAGATSAMRDAAWDNYESAIDAAVLLEQEQHADLLREIIGNPFRPTAPASFAPVVVQLAEAMYDGATEAFALHDALIEEGHATLAEHFQRPGHPRGCWALDAILGR